MDKFKQILKKKVEDQTAAFAILGAMVITFAITITTFEYIKYSKIEEVSSDLLASQTEQGEISLDTSENSESLNITENIVENEIDEEEIKEKNEKEYEKLKKENKISSKADKYYIKVNYGAQVVTIYEQDSNGKYTKPIKAMVCSTGTYTPKSGVYRTLGKRNWWKLMGGVYGQYSTHIMGDILFHSVPYLKKGDKSSLKYSAYDQLGEKVSMGCVRLTVKDAKWIYDNCSIGTQVEFYSSSNPGPLGKPTTRKISDAPSNVRGWDPTDPDSNNPWPAYLKELETNKEEEKNENKIENTINNNTITNGIIVNDTTNNNTVVNEVTKEEDNEITNSTVNETVENTTSANTVLDTNTNVTQTNTSTTESTNAANYQEALDASA